MLGHIVERLKWVKELNEIVVATSREPSDDPIYEFCREGDIACYRGSLEDVLDRFYQAALLHQADAVVRVTGDCPCVDPELVSQLIRSYRAGHYDHIGIATGAGAIFMHEGRFPNGSDAECFSLAALQKAWSEAVSDADREHVTPYIWRNKEIFKCGSLKPDRDYSHIRLSVDHQEDFDLISSIYAALYDPQKPFSMQDIIGFLHAHPALMHINRQFIGQEGYLDLWKPDALTGTAREERKTNG